MNSKLNQLQNTKSETDSPIQKFADLAGKTVAINVPGNVNELSLSVLAEASGMNIQDVRADKVLF